MSTKVLVTLVALDIVVSKTPANWYTWQYQGKFSSNENVGALTRPPASIHIQRTAFASEVSGAASIRTSNGSAMRALTDRQTHRWPDTQGRFYTLDRWRGREKCKVTRKSLLPTVSFHGSCFGISLLTEKLQRKYLCPGQTAVCNQSSPAIHVNSYYVGAFWIEAKWILMD